MYFIKQFFKQQEMSTMATNSREKFVKLANARVNNALKNIILIGNLSNRSNYTYGENDIKEIFRSLRKEIDSAERRFKESGSGDREEFKIQV